LPKVAISERGLATIAHHCAGVLAIADVVLMIQFDYCCGNSGELALPGMPATSLRNDPRDCVDLDLVFDRTSVGDASRHLK
jgi:hypothetical protein